MRQAGPPRSSLRGLLTISGTADRDAESVVVLGGGAMGGLLGPADGLTRTSARSSPHPAAGSACCGSAGANSTTSTAAPTTCWPRSTWPRGQARRGHRWAQLQRRRGGAGRRRPRRALRRRGHVRHPVRRLQVVPSLQAPLLAFHGDRDELLPLAAPSSWPKHAWRGGELRVCRRRLHGRGRRPAPRRGPAWIRAHLADAVSGADEPATGANGAAIGRRRRDAAGGEAAAEGRKIPGRAGRRTRGRPRPQGGTALVQDRAALAVVPTPATEPRLAGRRISPAGGAGPAACRPPPARSRGRRPRGRSSRGGAGRSRDAADRAPIQPRIDHSQLAT